MTKYILHGGYVRRKTEDNRNFFREIINDLQSPIRILCIYFANVNKNEWSESFENDKENFSSVGSGKNLIFEMASEETDLFIEQIKIAQVIYMRGGHSSLILQEYLEKVNDLENLWKGKVVVGSSAGAYVLSEYYYEDETHPLNKGLGILPIKVFCHYTEDQSDKLKKLKEFDENIETVYIIPDEKFFVIEK